MLFASCLKLVYTLEMHVFRGKNHHIPNTAESKHTEAGKYKEWNTVMMRKNSPIEMTWIRWKTV